jgi:hypothetical protein
MSAEGERLLLRRFEPIVRYTKGEQFFPTDIEQYLKTCSLWVQRPNRYPLRLWPEGELTPERLAEPRNHGFDATYYLKLIDPLNITEVARLRIKEGLARLSSGELFRAGPGRLARVGYGSRFVDALFSLSLLARGRVPGDTALAASLAYQEMLKKEERYCYYGRVVEQSDWIVLQYWFFYAYNNWRSGYEGANDHEGDWEMICIYLYRDGNGEIHPEWVAYASHDFSGDDLRRRWDDKELEKFGEHPVVYAGAGSHASYFQSGEYLAEIELPFLTPVIRFTKRLQEFWQKNILPYDNRQEADGEAKMVFSLFRIPFVDYARGEGMSIGPEHEKSWIEPAVISNPPGWVSQYRGLWGLYAQDPFAGENAPAGPMYNRDGTIRQAWYDPLGWAGLDKVPPPQERLNLIQARRIEIKADISNIETQIEKKSRELQKLGIELASMRGFPHLRDARDLQQAKINEMSNELDLLRKQIAMDESSLETLSLYAGRIEAGERAPVRAHIRRAHHPTTSESIRLNKLAEIWAAVSIGLMMISFLLLAVFASDFLIYGIASVISLIVFVEASFRGQITRFISSITVGLAVVAGLIIFLEFFWVIVVILVLIAGGYITWENIRELRR